jgi:hypothetical protein
LNSLAQCHTQRRMQPQSRLNLDHAVQNAAWSSGCAREKFRPPSGPVVIQWRKKTILKTKPPQKTKSALFLVLFLQCCGSTRLGFWNLVNIVDK